MQSLPSVSEETVAKTKFVTYDLESMVKPGERIDASGNKTQNLSIIAASIFMIKANKEEMIKSWYINDPFNYMDSKSLIRNFLNWVINYVSRYKINELTLYAHNAFSSNHPTLRQKGWVIKEKVVNFLLEIHLR
jgi:poly(3-hydroxyalkanoate) synthetase